MNRSKAPYNPVEHLEAARFKKVDQQKKSQRETLESQLFKPFKNIEDIPADWSLKTGLDITITNPDDSCGQLHKKLREISKFYVYNTTGCHNFSSQSQSKFSFFN